MNISERIVRKKNSIQNNCVYLWLQFSFDKEHRIFTDYEDFDIWALIYVNMYFAKVIAINNYYWYCSASKFLNKIFRISYFAIIWLDAVSWVYYEAYHIRVTLNYWVTFKSNIHISYLPYNDIPNNIMTFCILQTNKNSEFYPFQSKAHFENYTPGMNNIFFNIIKHYLINGYDHHTTFLSNVTLLYWNLLTQKK